MEDTQSPASVLTLHLLSARASASVQGAITLRAWRLGGVLGTVQREQANLAGRASQATAVIGVLPADRETLRSVSCGRKRANKPPGPRVRRAGDAFVDLTG
jgi:hypothetical protein